MAGLEEGGAMAVWPAGLVSEEVFLKKATENLGKKWQWVRRSWPPPAPGVLGPWGA